MAESAKRRATYDDLRAAPADRLAEILNGELILSPRPALGHARVASVLGMDLGSPFERGRGGPGGWWIVDEPELHLGPDVLVPDLAGWRRERMPSPPSGPYATVSPDWVCEVVSPSTARTDRVRKLPIYAREEVKHIWLIDPDARTLEVLRLSGHQWLMVSAHSNDDKVRAEPFVEVELDLQALWLPHEAP